MFSVGVLYSSQTLLEVIEVGGVDTANFAASFAKIGVADAGIVLSTAQKCRWLRIEEDGAIRLTERGAHLRTLTADGACLREQLYDLVVAEPPPWSKKLIYGRFEALKAMPPEAKQCFGDCGLNEGIDEDVVDWWHRAGGAVRSERSKAGHIVGQKAERYSLDYEKKRTGTEPLWQGFETTVAGYDVLSIVEPGVADRLKIEVKGSSQNKSDAYFRVTRNEWNTATTSKNYLFHLWLVQTVPKLFVVPAAEVAAHIPANQGAGQWTDAELYFRDFKHFEQPLTA